MWLSSLRRNRTSIGSLSRTFSRTQAGAGLSSDARSAFHKEMYHVVLFHAAKPDIEPPPAGPGPKPARGIAPPAATGSARRSLAAQHAHSHQQLPASRPKDVDLKF